MLPTEDAEAAPEPEIDPDQIREALLALEGTVIEDFQLPLPGSLKDIAKASELVSGVVEDRIPALLNSVRDRTWDEDGHLHAYEFRRFTIGFPDILLVERANPEHVLFEIEAKSWYILAGDALTARFKTSQTILTEGTVVAVVAWVLDGVVAGSPKLLRIYTDDALRLAQVRDERWTEHPETHRVAEPENAPGTARNLVKTQALGEILSGAGNWEPDRDNFGKLERLGDAGLLQFRDSVLSLAAGGRSFGDWRRFIFPPAAKKARAAAKTAPVKAAKKIAAPAKLAPAKKAAPRRPKT